MSCNFSDRELQSIFNEWMRRYTENPAAFEAEFQTVSKFLADQNAGKEPSYGEVCLAYLHDLKNQEIARIKAFYDSRR
jgi:hypothetical protein